MLSTSYERVDTIRIFQRGAGVRSWAAPPPVMTVALPYPNLPLGSRAVSRLVFDTVDQTVVVGFLRSEPPVGAAGELLGDDARGQRGLHVLRGSAALAEDADRLALQMLHPLQLALEGGDVAITLRADLMDEHLRVLTDDAQVSRLNQPSGAGRSPPVDDDGQEVTERPQVRERLEEMLGIGNVAAAGVQIDTQRLELVAGGIGPGIQFDGKAASSLRIDVQTKHKVGLIFDLHHSYTFAFYSYSTKRGAMRKRRQPARAPLRDLG